MSLHPPHPKPLPRHTPNPLKTGVSYTVRCAQRAETVKPKCLDGDLDGNLTTGTREVTSGSRMTLRHHDPVKGFCYLEIYVTGLPIRLPEGALEPWSKAPGHVTA